jgi:hypothetical protein
MLSWYNLLSSRKSVKGQDGVEYLGRIQFLHRKPWLLPVVVAGRKASEPLHSINVTYMKLVRINEGENFIRGKTEVSPPGDAVHVAIYPHKMLEWVHRHDLCATDFNCSYYTIAMGLTRTHPQLKYTCFLTIRQTYCIRINNNDMFRAVGESVYKINYTGGKVSEDILLQLSHNAFDWFIDEFISKSHDTKIRFSKQLVFPLEEVTAVIHESMNLAGYR